MIDKENAKKHSIRIKESGEKHQQKKQELIKQIKKLLPRIIDSDNNLNIKALEGLVNVSGKTSKTKGYDLTFAGKEYADYLADLSTKYEFKTERKQSKDFENTSNVVIRGDNLNVLKILYQNYFGKVKMIYIDPPYNTKSEEFVYKDDFKVSDKELIEDYGMDEEEQKFLQNTYGTRAHSGWLAFMYPRLKLARELLSKDGMIFISIDDHESANLKIICDGIFGEANFISQITVKSNPGGRDYGGVALTHDYVLVYSKSIDIEPDLIENKEKVFKYEDELGPFNDLELRNRSVKFNIDNRPNLYYPFYVNPTSADKDGFYEVSLEARKGWTEVFPLVSQGVQTVWRWGKPKSQMNLNTNVKAKKKRDGTFMIIKKDRSSLRRVRSILDDKGVRTERGSLRLKEVFDGEKPFDYPKSDILIKTLVELGAGQDEEALVLDFFAGSGTTGDAVMQLNAEDGGQRKFILIQADEKINRKKNTEAYDYCSKNKLQPVISSVTIERLNRAGEKIRQDIEGKNGKKGNLIKEGHEELPDIGYKVYSLEEKPKILEDGGIFKASKTRSTEDILINMMCVTLKTLETPITEIEKNKIYMAGGEVYVIDQVTPAQLKEVENIESAKINLNGWANIDLNSMFNLSQSFEENLTVIY